MTQHYFGVEFNQYQVYKLEESGLWRAIEIGDVSNAEMGRAISREKKGKAPKSTMASPTKASPRGKRATTTTKPKNPWTQPRTTVQSRIARHDWTVLSPFQQRMEQLKDNARRTIDEKRACGESA